MTVQIRNVSAAVVRDQAGRDCIVALGTDSMGQVWVNRDVLGGEKWSPVTKRTVATVGDRDGSWVRDPRKKEDA